MCLKEKKDKTRQLEKSFLIFGIKRARFKKRRNFMDPNSIFIAISASPFLAGFVILLLGIGALRLIARIKRNRMLAAEVRSTGVEGSTEWNAISSKINRADMKEANRKKK